METPDTVLRISFYVKVCKNNEKKRAMALETSGDKDNGVFDLKFDIYISHLRYEGQMRA